MGAVFALYSAWYFWVPKIIGLWYNLNLSIVHFWVLFVGVNLTFFPQHFLGLQGMPRRISDYPDAFAGWNLISSYGSIISVIATYIFLHIVYYQLTEGEAISRYPWIIPEFYSDSLRVLSRRVYSSLEWALNSPPKPHAFVSLPLQSKLGANIIQKILAKIRLIGVGVWIGVIFGALILGVIYYLLDFKLIELIYTILIAAFGITEIHAMNPPSEGEDYICGVNTKLSDRQITMVKERYENQIKTSENNISYTERQLSSVEIIRNKLNKGESLSMDELDKIYRLRLPFYRTMTWPEFLKWDDIPTLATDAKESLESKIKFSKKSIQDDSKVIDSLTQFLKKRNEGK